MTTTKKKGLSEHEIKIIKQLLTDLYQHLKAPGVNAGFGYFQAVDCEEQLDQLSIKNSFLEVWKFIDILSRDRASLMQLVQVRRGDLKYMISWLQLTLFAIEGKENKEILDTVSDDTKLLVEQYYPNDKTLPDLKTKLFDCYYYMTYYYACKNVILALKKLTGLNREIMRLASYADIEDAYFSPSRITFEDAHKYYENSSKNTETDFSFMLACLKKLNFKIPKGMKCVLPYFDISRFKPKEENIDKCIDEILSNKPNFIGAYEFGKIAKLGSDLEKELIKFERFEMGYY